MPKSVNLHYCSILTQNWAAVAGELNTTMGYVKLMRSIRDRFGPGVLELELRFVHSGGESLPAYPIPIRARARYAEGVSRTRPRDPINAFI